MSCHNIEVSAWLMMAIIVFLLLVILLQCHLCHHKDDRRLTDRRKNALVDKMWHTIHFLSKK